MNSRRHKGQALGKMNQSCGTKVKKVKEEEGGWMVAPAMMMKMEGSTLPRLPLIVGQVWQRLYRKAKNRYRLTICLRKALTFMIESKILKINQKARQMRVKSNWLGLLQVNQQQRKNLQLKMEIQKNSMKNRKKNGRIHQSIQSRGLCKMIRTSCRWL